MTLLRAHLVLVGAAIAMAVIFGVRGVVRFSRGAGSTELAIGVLSLAVAAALAVYFRQVRGRVRAGRRTSA